MREEYPRPELRRDKWLTLNGEWDFAFDFGASGVDMYFYDDKNKNYRFSELSSLEFDKKINVPFCPESKLSGVEYTDFINACRYRKTVTIPEDWKGRILLHFEAAFYETHVMVNNKYAGVHRGGYTPFSFDITDYIQDGKATVFVYCSGDSRNPKQPSGKQSMAFHPSQCFYTRSTGIWAPVWLECVPEIYLTGIRLDSDIDNACINMKLRFSSLGKKKVTANAVLDGVTAGSKTVQTNLCETFIQLPLKVVSEWSIENPVLYDLKITLESECGTDEIYSYFGMRSIELDKRGVKLNGKRICMKMVLDQGYYSDGLYTAPTSEDFGKDIALAQALGFNGARLHQKVFERRYLYECDRRGYIVWGEYPSWGFDYTASDALQYFLGEWLEAVERDYNHPSIIGWCPLNENWDIFSRKQNDDFVRQIYIETKRIDSMRPCIDVSWNYHVKTDIFDTHDYESDENIFVKHYAQFEDEKIFDPFGQQYNGEPFFLSEYGGIVLADKNEGVQVASEAEWIRRFVLFTRTLLNNSRVAGFCYTQLYDVEHEKNGIYYYDRTPRFSKKTMSEIKKLLDKKAAIEEAGR